VRERIFTEQIFKKRQCVLSYTKFGGSKGKSWYEEDVEREKKLLEAGKATRSIPMKT